MNPNTPYFYTAIIACILAAIGWGIIFYRVWSARREWKMPKVSDGAYNIVSLILRDFIKMSQETHAAARADAPPGHELIADMFPLQIESAADRNEHKESGIKWHMIYTPRGKSFITISGGEDAEPNLKNEVAHLLRWNLYSEKRPNVLVCVE